MRKSMSLKYEPSSEMLHNSANWLFFDQELYRTVQPMSNASSRMYFVKRFISNVSCQTPYLKCIMSNASERKRKEERQRQCACVKERESVWEANASRQTPWSTSASQPRVRWLRGGLVFEAQRLLCCRIRVIYMSIYLSIYLSLYKYIYIYISIYIYIHIYIYI